jgi:uncharacterized membrane protein YfcA
LSVLTFVELVVIGGAASIFGSLVGLGGGFIVIPFLRLLFNTPPTLVSGTSLVFVFANTASAAVGYFRNRRIDFSLALPLIIGGVPGALLGVVAVHYFSPKGFDLTYGVMLVVLAILIMNRRNTSPVEPFAHTFAHRWPVALAAGFAVGVSSTLFGIGGGIVLVPLLLLAARMPAHIVAATSGFVIFCSAPVGIASHALSHDIDWAFALPLVIGGIAGGSVAPEIQKRISSPRLITLLAFGFILAAVGLAARYVHF